jgi:rhodanese-related sulfurtransferase
MSKAKLLIFLLAFLLLASTSAMAQYPVINADQVKSWMEGKKAVCLIDARPAEEYQKGHIAGAVNIMPDNMKTSSTSLPRDKAAPIIFYCRGMN